MEAQGTILLKTQNKEERPVILSLSSMKKLIGKIPFEILNILSHQNNPMYSKAIKDEIESVFGKTFTEQTIYYHLRNLLEHEFLETIPDSIKDDNQRNVNIQKYKIQSKRFIFDFSPASHINKKIPEFLNKFKDINNEFRGYLVFGERSNDSPYIGPISFLLGKYFNYSENFVHFDSYIEDKQLYDNNLILLGGPRVNNILTTVSESENKQLNDLLPVKFSQTIEPGLIIQSINRTILSKNCNVGVIQYIENPWNPKRRIIVIGGPRKIGTETAVYSFAKKTYLISEILKTSSYCLVEPIIDEKGNIEDINILN